jgi:hypothetical protein
MIEEYENKSPEKWNWIQLAQYMVGRRASKLVLNLQVL